MPRRPRSPPYLAIAAELRSQIRAGALAAGDQLPSTRALARRHRVAQATAAHALRTLIQEGAAEAVAGVGTRVAGPRSGAGPRGEAELTLGRLVRTAIAIADDEGLDALSVRGVAAKLGVSPMALYRHVNGKDSLLEQMVNAALQEERLPDQATGSWRARLEVAARLEWKVLRRHPWLARLINVSRPRPLPPALRLTDWVLAALEHTGLSPSARMQTHILLHAFIQGLGVNLEEEARATGETGLTDQDWMRSKQGHFDALGARLPAFGRFLRDVRDGFDFDFDQLFEFGLPVLLDGIEAMMTGGRRGRSTGSRSSRRHAGRRLSD